MLVSGRNISKTYTRAALPGAGLVNASFSIAPGEFVAIVGSSGSGKSTLMNLIGLLDRPTSGELRIAGDSVRDMDEAKLARLRAQTVGFVFQSYNLLPRCTALENVLMPLSYAGTNVQGRRDKAMRALTQVGLASKAARRPAEMSGGEQQRVAIARALVRDPPILLADEPTGALDTATANDILRLFQALHQVGHTVILVTHDQHIASLAQRTIRLRDGEVVASSWEAS